MRTPHLLLFTLLQLPGWAVAADPEHDAHPLVVSATLTLGEAVRAAAERNGNAIESAAAMTEAETIARRAELPFAAPPALWLRHNRDWPGEDLGLLEVEAQVELSLKRFGQTRAQRALADTAEAQVLTDNRAASWQIAGAVREAIWSHRLAVLGRRDAATALELAVELNESVDLRHRLGDVSRADLLLVKVDGLARRRELEVYARELADAERRYLSLTGLDAIPGDPAELPLEPLPLTEHPALAAAADRAERARRAVATQRYANSPAPIVSIGPRRERGASNQTPADSFGFTLRIPFGGSAYAATAVAAAERGVTSAEVDYQRLRRGVELALHEALHELGVARTLAANACDWRDLGAQREHIARVAFDNGEIDLAEFIRARNDANDARRECAAAEIRVAQAIARSNQAGGHLPTGALPLQVNRP